MKGLLHSLNISFRWDKKGAKLITRRAKANGMTKAQYLRYAVVLETDISDKLFNSVGSKK